MWKLGILSRIGLVGAGFLSVLHDSIAMEDRADDASRRYLRERGMDEALLMEAVFMLETETYLEEETHKPRPPAVSCDVEHNIKRTPNLQNEESLLGKICQTFRTTYDYYFKLELYDYLHREAKHRRALSNS